MPTCDAVRNAAPDLKLALTCPTPSSNLNRPNRLAVFCLLRRCLASLVEVRIISAMRNRWRGDVFIVAATKDSQTEYWVAATRREEAVAAVQQLLAPGWTATLTDRRISPAQVAVLHLSQNYVRKLRYVP